MSHATFVITLDPGSPRFAQFRASNSHLQPAIFRGVPGSGLSREERLKQNLVTADCLDADAVTHGEVGAAASHVALWREVYHRQQPFLILEDDVITHPQIEQVVTGLDLSAVDMIFFAINTDAVLGTISPEGVHEFSTFEDRYPEPSRIAAILAQTDLSRLSLRRMLYGFGLCCYLVTPQGAEKILRDALPLRRDMFPLVGYPGARVSGTSIDRRLNALFADMRVFIMRPFLAWTPNMESTTRRVPMKR